jgi:hypothetical protein
MILTRTAVTVLLLSLLVAGPARSASDKYKDEERNDLSLSGLVANPYRPGVFIRTPREEVRRRFAKPAATRRRVEGGGEPAISGTTLMLRAISTFNAKKRRPMIGDVVRHLRHYPNAKDQVWVLVDRYRANNPQMRHHVDTVKAMVEAALAKSVDKNYRLLN